MSALDEKRQEIAAALAVVMPDGRFSAYPRPMTRGVAPAGWIEQPFGGEQSLAGSNTRQIVATFPVWFVFDGTDEAQVAGLDDVVTKAWQALTPVAQVHPRRWRSATLPVLGAGSGYSTMTNTLSGDAVPIPWRAVVLDVEATFLAVSFCAPPVPEPVDIPPVIVQL